MVHSSAHLGGNLERRKNFLLRQLSGTTTFNNITPAGPLPQGMPNSVGFLISGLCHPLGRGGVA
jgi:hypothetical protein